MLNFVYYMYTVCTTLKIKYDAKCKVENLLYFVCLPGNLKITIFITIHNNSAEDNLYAHL